MTIIGRFYGYAELLTPKKEIWGLGGAMIVTETDLLNRQVA